MALKAVHITDVPNLDLVPETAAFSYVSSRFSKESNKVAPFKVPKFTVVGHRGSGMNILQSSDHRMKVIKENTISSFNSAALFPIDFVEFDVQVTKDDCPVVFHDNFIFTSANGTLVEKRVTELTLSEFLTYGPQRGSEHEGKPLLRKTKDGRIISWTVEEDDSLCTLQEVFEQVEPSLGFNIELKFDDHIVYHEDYLIRVLRAILQVVFEYGRSRPIIFSSFQPDAALLIRKLQDSYPVFFLTNGGNETFYDKRRNSLEEAINVCLDGQLQGIVSEVRGVLRNPAAVNKIKDSNLALFTYGQLNNSTEAVYVQYLMGIDGVIVDLVKEVTEAVKELILTTDEIEEGDSPTEETTHLRLKPKFSQKELTFLLKLIPELIRH